ncbi:uncharacterized protein LOC107409833 [Ziziphus jujuba]|uniref:Uncharacterized protein LOC107409833 n=1 Tax=Ziziphus jujuba TaxID=326968 RepID=A0ABM3ICX1_ZIZJJ|nr:uncharacterized protein LOC107409833 [Ziziphus jujuba]XP_048325748.2 uncharacterized protein LOC107409833 [Ziziphus jujuba]XP_048325749.2 uncharacterized protein LOC107409833 [Ziziphus jujuba]
MPYCEVESQQSSVEAELNNGTKLFYRTYGRGPTKVLLIIGLAATHDAWGPQIKGLTGTDTPNDDSRRVGDCPDNEAEAEAGGIEFCAFDNRGMGRSSVPTKKSQYTTKVMAKDAIALLDHLGWKKAHVFGHSMGGMIACKLAAMVPERVLSLALLNVTGGGFECFPKFDRQTLSIAIRFLRAKTPEQRAAVDLDTHYSKEYLEEYVGSATRRAILYQEYVKGITATGMQSNYGFEGQINACWTHKVTRTEIELIRSAGFLVSVIHGRYDVIAQISHARRLAEKLHPVARMVDLHGGHLVSHERTEEVNKALMELIEASKLHMKPHEWTNLPNKSSGWMQTRSSTSRTSTEGGSGVSFMCNMSEKLYLCLLYFVGLFALTFDFAKRTFKRIKPVRVGATLT